MEYGPNFGFASAKDVRTWQMHFSPSDSSEEFADMFLGWVFNRWEVKGNGDFTDAGKTRSTWMDQNMKAWITK